MPARRPPLPIVSANFMQLEKVDNKSNHYWWKCNHCSNNGAGAHIQGHDNNHIKHLTDTKKCPNAPSDVCKMAWIFLVGKGIKNAFSDPINAVPSASADGTVSDDTSAPGVVAVKRRWNLDGFVDYPLTEAQQAHANVKLFWCVTCGLLNNRANLQIYQIYCSRQYCFCSHRELVFSQLPWWAATFILGTFPLCTLTYYNGWWSC